MRNQWCPSKVSTNFMHYDDSEWSSEFDKCVLKKTNRDELYNKKVVQIVPIITVRSRFYFGNRNCRHEITNRTLADNRIMKAATLPKVYLILLLVQEFPLRHAKLGISQKCVTYFTMCCRLDNDGQLWTQQISHVPWFSTFLLTSYYI